MITWGHGTTGFADQCAPTRYDNEEDRETNGTTLERYLDQGYTVVRSDYEGLGTPGLPPYLIGRSEGRSMLDAVRAAREAVPSLGKEMLVAGHSQGGHAALWASAMAPKYTPELRLHGTLAFAPQSHTAEELEIFPSTQSSRTSAPTANILRGIDIASPGFDATTVLSDRGLELYPDTLTLSTQQLTQPDSFGGVNTSDLFVSDPDLSKAISVAEQNDPKILQIKKPIRIEQGLSDGTVPEPFDRELSESLSANGATVA